jgi:hypothetical protein
MKILIKPKPSVTQLIEIVGETPKGFIIKCPGKGQRMVTKTVSLEWLNEHRVWREPYNSPI